MTIPNEIILASAGSGKTYQLTNRYIKLLAAGVSPDSIVALTFTRKAAGEFLDAILRKLAAATSDPEKAKGLCEELGLPGGADFLGLLRELVAKIHLLNLGTLDSFFMRIMQGLPLELGMGGQIEILGDEAAIARARRPVYEDVFRGAGQQGSPTDAFLLAFKEASYGNEERRMVSQLDRFVSQHHRDLLSVPEEGKWGRAAAVWPDGCPWPTGEREEYLAALAKLQKRIARAEKSDKQNDWWEEIFEQAESHNPGATMGKRLEDVTKKLAAALPDLGERETGFPIAGKKFIVDVATGEAAKGFFSALVGLELEAKLLRTRGLWSVLSLYEEMHERRLRRRGRVGFDDVVILLSRYLAEVRGVASDLAYRLDARFDHWMLDEFQDTSRRQWSVVQPLVDEVVQDPEGRRTYFQVGDMKQSIYGWRGGDPSLINDVRARYRGSVVERPLARSFRSVPAVLETVNRVFGDTEGLAAHLPRGAAERLEWRDHAASAMTQGESGFATLIHPAGDKPTTEDVYAAALGIVREVDPLARGWTCAIICQSNGTIREVVDFFRGNGFPDVVSGARVAAMTDNPVTTAFLALLLASAFPGDGFAGGQVALTPLARVWQSEGRAFCQVQAEVLGDIGREGFEFVLRKWRRALEAVGGLPEDARFARHRLDQLVDLARVFDGSGDRSVLEFLSLAENFQTAEVPESGVIQVMTTHASKGLGFDMVVLPELEGKNLKSAREGLGIGGTNAHPEWVLDLPTKTIREADPILSRHLAAQEEESAFDNLCRIYVAMTRPKRGLYLVARPRGAKSVALNDLTLLDGLLGEIDEPTSFGGVECTLRYAHGDRDWYAGREVVSVPSAQPEPDMGTLRLGGARLGRRAPSREGKVGLGSPGALAFGREVHRVFQTIGWAGDGHPVPGGDSEAAAAVRKCMGSAAVQALLARPSGTATLWREKNFEAVVGGDWVSGTFDRVQLDGAPGSCSAATIIDFKTGGSSETYRPQMESYRRVLAALVGLPLPAIRCALVFVRDGSVEVV